MNFRQTFSFYKKRLELKTKDIIGFRGDVYSMVSLPDGSIVFAGALYGFTDSKGKDYPTISFNISQYTLIKMMPNGELDQNFITNMGLGFNGLVSEIVTDGTSLYAVGSFDSFNGAGSNAKGIAKFSIDGVFDTSFSNNLDVVPGTKANSSGFNGSALCISLDNDNIYVGGSFSSFKGVSYNANGIAKLSKLGIFDTSFSNNLDVVPGTKDNNTSGFLDGAVYNIYRLNSDLYVGGAFTRFKSTEPNARRIAKLTTAGIFNTEFSDNLDVVPGIKNSTTSGFNNPVRKIVSDETSLYIVGDFNKIKSNTSSPSNAGGLAKLSLSGVFDTAFSDNLDIVSGTKTFSSGFNKSSGYPTLMEILLDGTDIYVVGNMESFKGISNNAKGVAKLSTAGVFDTTFSDNLDVVPGIKNINSGVNTLGGSVNAIHQHENSLYLGGSFYSFKDSCSLSVQKISKLGTSENFVESRQGFSQQISGVAMDEEGNRYVGHFTTTGSTTYNGKIFTIAKILPNGNLDETFINNIGIVGFNGYVQDILVVDNNLYVIGGFTSFNGISNNAKGIAKFTTSGVFDTAFSDNLDVVPGTKALSSGFNGFNSTPLAIATDGSNLYIGGDFNSFKGTNTYNANKIAKLSLSGVFDTSFSNNLDVVPGTKNASTSGFSNTFGPVRKILVHGSDLYIGGLMESFKGIAYNAMKIAKLSTSGVFNTEFSDNLDVVPGTKSLTSSGFNNYVYDMCTDGTSLYVVGAFSRCKSSTTIFNANKIAKLSMSGVFDTAFSDNLDVVSGSKTSNSGFGYDSEGNNPIRSIFIINNSLFVGGFMSSFKGTLYNSRGLAKLSTSGIFDTNFSNYLDIVPGVKNSDTSGGFFPTKIIYSSKYNSIVMISSTNFKGQKVDRLFSISYMD